MELGAAAAAGGFDEEVRAMVPDLDLPKIPTSPSKAVTGYISGLVSGMGDMSPSTASASTAVGEEVEQAVETGFTPTMRTSRDGVCNNLPTRAGRHYSGGPTTAQRRPAAMPSWSMAGTLSADSRSADTVFVFDEPSMN